MSVCGKGKAYYRPIFTYIYNSSSPINQMKTTNNEKVIRLLKLILSTAALAGIYIVGVSYEFTPIVYIYYGLLLASSVAFVIINRGLSKESPDADSLPSDWSYVKKCEYIEKDKARKQKAKPLLYIVIPLLLIFAFDILYMQYFS